MSQKVVTNARAQCRSSVQYRSETNKSDNASGTQDCYFSSAVESLDPPRLENRAKIISCQEFSATFSAHL
jgi:hypothetical protein